MVVLWTAGLLVSLCSYCESQSVITKAIIQQAMQQYNCNCICIIALFIMDISISNLHSFEITSLPLSLYVCSPLQIIR